MEDNTMEEKETVDPATDLDEAIQEYLRGKFVNTRNITPLKRFVQAAFTMTHFMCNRIDPNMVLMGEKLRTRLSDDDEDEEYIDMLEQEVEEVGSCVEFSHSVQEEVIQYTCGKLGKTPKELEIMAMIASEMVNNNENEDD
jgi:hypothetical protein